MQIADIGSIVFREIFQSKEVTRDPPAIGSDEVNVATDTPATEATQLARTTTDEWYTIDKIVKHVSYSMG